MRKFIAASLSALLLASTTASAQRVISMATLAPQGTTWMRVFDAANRDLRRRSNGQLSMRWYAGGVQGDEAEVVRKIRTGRLDGAAITAVGLSHIYRPILAFMVPGIFPNPGGLVRARDTLRADIEHGFEAAGFSLMGFGGSGATRMFSRRLIRTPADLRAAHPWQWREDIILPAMFAEVGVTGVTLQVPEVLSAIQTNRVDTVTCTALQGVALQWTTQMQYMSERASGASLGAMVISRSVIQSLPADQQQLLREITTQYDTLLARNVARDDDAAAATLQQRGLQVVTLTDAERAQWNQVFTRTRTRLAGAIADAAWMSRVEAAGR